MTNIHKQGKKRVIVADDKWENIEGIRALAPAWQKRGLIIDDYHIDLRVPDQNANALYWYLLEYWQGRNEFATSQVILDLDNVSIDTDGAIASQATANLVKAKSRQTSATDY